MASVVESINAQARSEEAPVAEILSRTIFLSSVLGQKAVSHWFKCERDGYGADAGVPRFRCVTSATLLASRPGVGWVQAPITDKARDAIPYFELRQGIETLIKRYPGGRKTDSAVLELPAALQAPLRAQINLDAPLALAVPRQACDLILDTVRLTVFHFTQALIAAEVLGQGSSFRKEEREAAQAVGARLNELIAAAEADARQVQVPEARGGLFARLFGAS
ncbi:hypothetical protein CAI21_18740 [Alkalilimnicola ehrlichii]|uniref:AbiTii domain-containing protein n=1 Tax=Alkalilimnicola ehrlichii TaxID=351052 RepID=A0A3E0WI96_9GAMM|nr:hypothetical protein [Alkalilimnicola ehrlichii]RFA25565.1 hypothetical protein CAI21_18740 [Alkalilimnicola ehrlichii]RFA32692.1 hypothetical protein CAL65_18990 [Alkalilimnicola ehrlichii]